VLVKKSVAKRHGLIHIPEDVKTSRRGIVVSTGPLCKYVTEMDQILITKNDYERTKASVADKQTTLDAYR
jgi:hypothetical protein